MDGLLTPLCLLRSIVLRWKDTQVRCWSLNTVEAPFIYVFHHRAGLQRHSVETVRRTPCLLTPSSPQLADIQVRFYGLNPWKVTLSDTSSVISHVWNQQCGDSTIYSHYCSDYLEVISWRMYIIGQCCLSRGG